jgi:preprotein translocase subunit SecG
LDMANKIKFGGIIFLPLAVVLGILGLGTPVYFATVSERSLEDIGEGTKTIDEEMLRQLRQNNVGPAEMLLPLASVRKRQEFAKAIEEKKKSRPELSISGGGSIFDMLTFSEYFGGLDRFNLDRGRFEAFFVYNRATSRGDLWDRLRDRSSNDNVQALLRSIPMDGRPGFFWTKLMNEPLVFAFPGVKVAKLTDYPYFSGRKVLLSVGLRGPEAFEGNATEAQVRDLCLAEARLGLAEFMGNAEWFDVKKEGTESKIRRLEGNFSLPNSLDFSDLADRSVMLKLGRTDDGGYAVIIGGIINAEGKMESHGRWLPYPILVPMMVGTAMSLEKDYYSADTAFEIGRLSQKAIEGDHASKERIRAFYWSAHQLARKMNLIQMAELTQSCPDLQGVFDLAALVRMHNRPLSAAIGKVKAMNQETSFIPLDQREQSRINLLEAIDEKKRIQAQFESDLQIIYAATLLSGNPSGILRFVSNYPVYVKDGDDDAAESALEDIKLAMFYGKGALDHLLERNRPIYEPGLAVRLVEPAFPIFGGQLLTGLSHRHFDLSISLKIILLIAAFFCLLLFIAKTVPRPDYQRSQSHFALRWTRRFSASALFALLGVLALEPTLLQTPRGQVSVAGFDFALANLLAYANEESMADQNLTIVTAIVAGVFLLIQIVIFMICMSRVSQIKNEELKAGLKLGLLDNEENLFDLGLYIGLGGTVLSLILLLVLDVKQDALIGAYTSTLFGILFVAALKIVIIRPYRNHLLVKQAEEKGA